MSMPTHRARGVRRWRPGAARSASGCAAATGSRVAGALSRGRPDGRGGVHAWVPAAPGRSPRSPCCRRRPVSGASRCSSSATSSSKPPCEVDSRAAVRRRVRARTSRTARRPASGCRRGRKSESASGRRGGFPRARGSAWAARSRTRGSRGRAATSCTALPYRPAPGSCSSCTW